jgi:hypothetical protein
MKYKFKKNINVSTQEFWYDLTDGGYLKPSQFSDDPATLTAIKEAIKLIKQLEKMCELE